MSKTHGQALLELALCAPLVVLLALGTVAGVQVASARAGLEAATQAAVESAVRAPSAERAIAAANERFREVIADYPVGSATLVLSVGDFARAGSVRASASTTIDVAWAGLLLLPSRVTLRSQVRLPLESWRSHTG